MPIVYTRLNLEMGGTLFKFNIFWYLIYIYMMQMLIEQYQATTMPVLILQI